MVNGFNASCCPGVSEAQSDELKLAVTAAAVDVFSGLTRVLAAADWAKPGVGVSSSPADTAISPNRAGRTIAGRAYRWRAIFRCIKLGFLSITDLQKLCKTCIYIGGWWEVVGQDGRIDVRQFLGTDVVLNDVDDQQTPC